MDYFKPVSPTNGVKRENAIDISSYGNKPYNVFSPFTYSKDIQIPVPGQIGLFSNSVESIWQGLKIINGETDLSLLKKRPKKRKGNVLGHQFQDEVLGIVEARLDIFHPAYEFFFDNYIPKTVKDELVEKALIDTVLFYDTESNLDIENPEDPLAHSIFASDLMNKYVNSLFKKIILTFEQEYVDHGNETLAGPLTRSIKRYKEMNPLEQTISKIVLQNPIGKDAFHKRYYETLKERLL